MATLLLPTIPIPPWDSWDTETYQSFKMVSFFAVLERAWQVQQFLCANHTKIPYLTEK